MQLATTIQTMSSREISDLTGKELSHIHRDIRAMVCALGDDPVLDDLKEDKDVRGYTTVFHLNKVISWYAPMAYTHPQNGQTYECYYLNKRDSLIVVAQNCPEFTARIVDGVSPKLDTPPKWTNL